MGPCLLNVVAAWWDGRQTTDMEVFGWKMLYYGRAGKIMLLVAGLAVTSTAAFQIIAPRAASEELDVVAVGVETVVGGVEFGDHQVDAVPGQAAGGGAGAELL